MADTKERVKDEVRAILRELYETYQARGVLSLYLYGSITGSDFDPHTSDVDSIAICEASVSLDMEAEMQQFLAQRAPDIHKFGTRILYLDELKDLSERSNLTYFIRIQSLILDFPFWEYVAGTVFKAADFPAVSHEDGIRAMQSVLTKWDWNDVAHVQKDKIQNYAKVLARMLWNIDGSRGRIYRFSYSALADREDGYAGVAAAILDLKSRNWDEETFARHKALFQSFVQEAAVSSPR
jgi:hypothetical protein